MKPYSVALLNCFLILFIMLIYLLIKKEKSYQIWVFILTLCSFCFSFFTSVIFTNAADKETALFWFRLSFMTRPPEVAFFVLVLFSYYRDNRPLPAFLTFLIFLPTLPLSAAIISGQWHLTILIHPLGNTKHLESNNFWFYYYYFNEAAAIGTIITISIFKFLTNKLYRIKVLSIYLIILAVFAYASALVLQFLLPHVLKGYYFRESYLLSFFLSLIGMFYALLKFRFMKVALPLTTNTIINNIDTGLFITDAGGIIRRINLAASELTNMKEDDLIEREINTLFHSPVIPAGRDLPFQQNPPEWQTVYLNEKEKGLAPVEFYRSSVFDDFKDQIGYLVLLRKNNKLHEAVLKYQLTERELEIIILLNEGLGYQEIADRISVSLSTVRNHIQNIYQKTGVNKKTLLFKLFF